MKTIAIGTLALLLSLQGCTYFTEPLKQPVIEEKLNPTWLAPAKVGTLSLTPERRVVLVNFHNNRFCAEAPTEVGLDLAGIISATISASQGDQAKLEAGVRSALSGQNNVLNKRTQGMQLFLANSYFTCQMYMNGGIDERQLLEMQIRTLEIVRPLIADELQYLYRRDNVTDQKPKATATEKTSEQIKEEVNRTVEEILKTKSAKPEEAPKPKPR